MIKGLFNFVKLFRTDKPSFSQNVVTSMTGNPNFPTPAVPLVDITSAVDDLIIKNALAEEGSPLQIATANSAGKFLDNLLREQCTYVSQIANGDALIIQSSGFTPSKVRSPKGIPDPMSGQTISRGTTAGSVVLGSTRNVKALLVFTFYSMDPNISIAFLTANGGFVLQPNVTCVVSTKFNRFIAGLNSNTVYYFVTVPFNGAGWGPVSPIQSILVL